MVKVKICGLTSAKDAELALEFGADVLGFVFDPASPRFVDNFEGARNIPKKIGAFTLSCAVFGELGEAPPWFSLVQFAKGDGSNIKRSFIPAIRPVLGESAASVLKKMEGYSTVLLDAYHPDSFGGTGDKVDWDLAAELVSLSATKVILAGGLTPENVAQAIQVVKPYAVDVSSGVESAPGVKDPFKMKEFIAQAKKF